MLATTAATRFVFILRSAILTVLCRTGVDIQILAKALYIAFVHAISSWLDSFFSISASFFVKVDKSCDFKT